MEGERSREERNGVVAQEMRLLEFLVLDVPFNIIVIIINVSKSDSGWTFGSCTGSESDQPPFRTHTFFGGFRSDFFFWIGLDSDWIRFRLSSLVVLSAWSLSMGSKQSDLCGRVGDDVRSL